MKNEKLTAERVSDLSGYAIQRMLSKAKKLEESGENVIHFEFGEPDFNTPKFILDSAYEAMEEGYTCYTSSRGVKELREAIAEKYEENYGVKVDPESEVIVLPGSKHAIYSSLVAMINPGEEVIITDPCFPPYEFAVKLVGGNPVRVPLKEELDFKLDLEKLETLISSDTKMILLNFPNNPTGSVLEREEIKKIYEIAEEQGIAVLSDEVYDRFVYNEREFNSILSFSEIPEHAIAVNSFSKTYAMTGWRVGYAVARKDIIDKVQKVQNSSTTCAPSFSQIAGIKALKEGERFVEKMITEFSNRRKELIKRLNEIEGISCKLPPASFYAFPNIQDLELNSEKLSDYLLREAKVAVVPGSAFGEQGEGYIRISYATSMKNLEKGVERIRKALKGY